MRIRDWSSDVCSSDLKQPLEQLGAPAGQFVERERGPGNFGVNREHARPGRGFEDAVADAARGGVRRDDGARKRVVKGKSVAVRVDLGGRRLIKTKKARHQRTSISRYIIQARQIHETSMKGDY